MKSENIEPQNTQKYAEIYNGSREGQEKSFCVFLRCLRFNKQQMTLMSLMIRAVRVIRCLEEFAEMAICSS